MTPGSPERQLELFDLTRQPAPQAHPDGWRHFWFQLRYDQLLLAGIASLMGLTVVFAGGVERGKQLARSERPLLARQPSAIQPPATTSAVEPPVTNQAAPGKPSAETDDAGKSAPAQRATPKVKQPSKLASDLSSTGSAREAGRSRYAIQVVTYSRPHLAKQEMDRLRARGERTFLIMRDGRTMVYVGPFPSRNNAAEKLAMLKSRYQDCFLKTL